MRKLCSDSTIALLLSLIYDIFFVIRSEIRLSKSLSDQKWAVSPKSLLYYNIRFYPPDEGSLGIAYKEKLGLHYSAEYRTPGRDYQPQILDLSDALNLLVDFP